MKTTIKMTKWIMKIRKVLQITMNQMKISKRKERDSILSKKTSQIDLSLTNFTD
jgi:hypothetical protein